MLPGKVEYFGHNTPTNLAALPDSVFRLTNSEPRTIIITLAGGDIDGKEKQAVSWCSISGLFVHWARSRHRTRGGGVGLLIGLGVGFLAAAVVGWRIGKE